MRYALDFIALLRSDTATRKIAVELTCAKITKAMHGTPANMAKLKESNRVLTSPLHTSSSVPSTTVWIL